MDAVERFEIPTPFSTGSENCYLVDSPDVTLIDPGPATEEAYEALVANLDRRDYAVEDVDRILLTHPHPDHFGQSRRLKDEAGARVVAHRDATDRMADPAGYVDREQAFFRPFLVEMGVPEDEVADVVAILAVVDSSQEPVEVDRELQDGETIRAGNDLTAVHTPGHSPGSVCYVDSTADVAFTGDHVLAEVTPNPVLTIDPTAADGRTRNLPTYLSSLQRMLSRDVSVGYGGHRGPIPDLSARIREITSHHQSREEHVADVLAEEGRMTAYDLLRELFPDIPSTELFPAMSEVIGHLDLLEDEQRVETTRTNGVVEYDLRDGR